MTWQTEYPQASMSDLSALRNAKTLPQLARLLKLKGEYVSHSLYWYRQETPYTRFTIPKKGGGRRIIEAPNSRLKLLQSRLLISIIADRGRNGEQAYHQGEGFGSRLQNPASPL
ncbi:hypothetical protein F2981_21585 (plasmid) [Sinorhizobium meliloti]|nr:hypothetical protein [Sinorhizobium meliloti]